MLKGLKNQIKGYLLLLVQRQPKKPKKEKKRWLSRKPPKPKFTLDTQGFDLKEVGAGKAPKVEMGHQSPPVRAKKGAFHEFCLNCGAKLEGRWCSECGQKDSDYRRPYWTFLEDLTDNLFTRDSRVWRTLGYLLFLPGAMTRDYIQGKRIRYLPPIRLFLISIIMFFLTISLLDVAVFKLVGTPVTYDERVAALKQEISDAEAAIAALDETEVFDIEDLKEDIARDQARLEEVEAWREEQLARPDQENVRRDAEGRLIYDYDMSMEMFSKITEEDVHVPEDIIEETFEFDTGDEDNEYLKRLAPRVKRGLKNAAQDPTRLNNALNNWVPIIMGIFVPLTAFFLRFYYWKREQYIFNHLVFSLHFHTYIFFILTFFVLAQVLIGSGASTWMFVSAVPLYFLVGLKVATGQGWIRTFFKFLVIFIFYMVGFSIMLFSILVASLSEA